MTATDATARARVILEEELGEIRAFVDLTAAEIDTIAERLARALAPVLAAAEPQRDAA